MKKASEWNKKYLATPEGAAKRKAWLASPEGKASALARTERYWRKRLGVDDLEYQLESVRKAAGRACYGTTESPVAEEARFRLASEILRILVGDGEVVR